MRAHDWIRGAPFRSNQSFFLDLFRGRRGLRILDVGCGNGILTSPLASEHRVHGIDFSQPMLRHAKTNHLVPTRGLAEYLPFPDHSFDAVLCVEMLQCVEDDGEAVREMARVLRPGGLMALQTLNRSSWLRRAWRRASADRSYLRMYTAEELAAPARDSGLRVKQVLFNFYPLPHRRECRAPERPSPAKAAATSLILLGETCGDEA